MAFSAGEMKVSLVNHLADDLMVVNAARVSFGRRSETMTDADVGLINFLMRERHGSPFEHNAFVFHVETPIFVAREWFRHRIGSFNEFSGRYAEMPQEAYVPEEWRSQVGKPGSYTFTPADDANAGLMTDAVTEAYEASFRAYETILSLGSAKELARIVLPVGVFTQFYWTVNARSMMNFLSLRNHKNAQAEIRWCAEQVEQHFAELMPVTYAAWQANGRLTP